MEIKVGNFVKTYELNSGEISIDIIEHILNKNINISSWSGTDTLFYENSNNPIKIFPHTAIWDKRNKRWVFKHWDEKCACFSTIVLDACNEDAAMYRLLVENETVNLRYL